MTEVVERPATVVVTERNVVVRVVANGAAPAIAATIPRPEVIKVQVAGPQGVRGLSAYQVYVAEGGELSVGDWLASLAGDDGATIRFGEGAPANGLGANGDFYIDTASALVDLYAKAAGAYSVIATLRGADGDDGDDGIDGDDGSVIRNGSGAPGGGLGVDGDYYIDVASATRDLYFKAAGAYSIVATLRGTAGANGTNGTLIRTVFDPVGDVPDDSIGVDGDYYFVILTATNDTILFRRDAGVYAYYASLTGVAGTNGATIRNGSGAPANGLGVNGDYYIENDSDDRNLYFKAAGAYSIVATLRGPAGADGVDGAAGPDIVTLAAVLSRMP